ncbi:MAG: TonB-dependent receptor, partial [Ignavibacteriaceae bacterium]
MLRLNYLKLSRFIYVIALVTLIPAFSLFAQNGTVKGNVTDTKGVAIPYANVVLVSTTMGAAADVNGNFVISNVPAGNYTLRASVIGYKQSSANITVTTGGTATQNFSLAQDVLNMESVVITGTPGGVGVKKKDASFAITTISGKALDLLSPPSTAAALDLVPGVWSESSGGVAGANIFVRGLPSSGDAPFVTMSINGAPIYGTETLSFFEQSSIFRIDETIASTEALRGGPSSVYNNGEAGLTTNFNLKQGTDQTKGRVKYTTSDYSTQRFDAVLSGPLGDKFYYMVGGYARTSPGIRNTQFNSEKGAQFTVNLTRVFDKGVVNGFARLTNDHGQWILPMALGSGNDQGTFAQLGNATRYRSIRINSAGDSTEYDFADGRGWKGLVSGLNFNYELGAGWTVRDNLSYTNGDANTLGFVPGGSPTAVTSPMQTLGGKTITSGYVQDYSYWVVLKQIESFTNDISLTNTVENHKITVGAYQSYWTSTDFWSLGNTVTVHNVANGDIIAGSAQSGAFTLNEAGDARMSAIYAGDSWQLDSQFRLDFGARYDFFNLDYTLDGAGTYPDGVPDLRATLDGNDWAGTIALNYAVDNNLGLFARASKGSLFPNFDDVRSNIYNLDSGTIDSTAGGTILGVNGTVKSNLFNQFEAGVKIDQGEYSLFITGFLNMVEQFDGDVLSTRANALLKTRTFGVEVDGGLKVEAFRLNLVGTYQNGEITEAALAPATVGNKIWRQPDFQFRLAPSYDFELSNNVSASLYGAFRYVGKRWDSRANVFQLDSFTKMDLGLVVSTTSGITFNVSGDNLNNSHGLTEGDPRNPASANGRPILGRSV